MNKAKIYGAPGEIRTPDPLIRLILAAETIASRDFHPTVT